MAHIFATIRKKLHLLIHLQALRTQDLEQPTLSIVGLHKSEAFTGKFLLFSSLALESQQAFPGDQLEMAFLVPATDITAVDPYRQRAIRRWQLRAAETRGCGA